MWVRRGFALLIMTLSGIGHSETASARMQGNNDVDTDVLLRVASSSFHPVVKSFESDNSKPVVQRVRVNKPVKARVTKKSPSSKVYVPESKSFASMMKPAKTSAKKQYLSARKKKSIVARNKSSVPGVKNEIAADKKPIAAEIKQVLHAENAVSEQQQFISTSVKPESKQHAPINAKGKSSIAQKSTKTPAFSTRHGKAATVQVTTSKSVKQMNQKTGVANAFVEGRKPANANSQLFTTAEVNADPDRIDTAAATHSIFISRPIKRAEISMPGRSVGVVRKKPVEFVMPIDSALQAKQAAQTKAAAVANQEAKLVTAPPAGKDKIINNNQNEKQQVVKIVTADANRDDFYILGENDPVPSHLIKSPTGEMVVLGGDINEADKKIMEFKLAAIQAAQAKASKELAEKESTAKAIAELAVEVDDQASIENSPVVNQPEQAFHLYDKHESQAKANNKSKAQTASEKQLDTVVKEIKAAHSQAEVIKTAAVKKSRVVARKSVSRVKAKKAFLAKSKNKALSGKKKVIVKAVPNAEITPVNPPVKVAEADKPLT